MKKIVSYFEIYHLEGSSAFNLFAGGWNLSPALFIFFITLQDLQAQTANDALRYSSLDRISTARSVGTGGVMGSLGADLSVLSSNPAGLAWFRRSEFTITGAFDFANASSTLRPDSELNTTKDAKSNLFHLPSFGFVTASTNFSNWTTFNFAIGINRLVNFRREFDYEGISVGSIVERFQEIANSSEGLGNPEAGLAYEAEALYDFNNDGFYDSDYDQTPNADLLRSQKITTKGAINEMVFALAGSYRDKLQVGISIGVPFVNFTETKTYTEFDDIDQVPAFQDLEYIEDLTTTGAGINLKAGFNYRVNQMVRIGAAIHTPTSFTMEDVYSTNLVYRYTVDGQPKAGSANSGEGQYQYKLNTPMRLFGNLGLIFGKNGFIAGELEYLNYGKAKFGFEGFSAEESQVNDTIGVRFQPAMHFRLGGEYAYDIFRARAGIAVNPSPLASGDGQATNVLSLGAGIRGQSAYVDIAFRYRTEKSVFSPYSTFAAPTQLVDSKFSKGQVFLTFGVKL